MLLKILGIAVAIATTALSSQTPLGGYRYTFDVISSTIATSGWERSSAIVTGPTYIQPAPSFRNTTWNVDLASHLRDIVRSSAPFEWVEAGGNDEIAYGFHIPEGTTGYVAISTMWHILTGTLRTTSLAGHIIDEQMVTTISPKVLSSGELDGEVRFMKLELP
ncbi:hypothetical protein BGZ99_002099 [Dissophora globulifera]|uniref:Uncharacterized protein n=1 Tax=Dissophora globulifera TaxID=979702 RepID=A0A9P6R109_9FUNG|nr:hypothetical protein BGZ99_002099 [Dissophora globulifera]